MSFKVGQEVTLVIGSRYRPDEPARVVRVGRKYVYVELLNRPGREEAARFDRVTGREVSGHGSRWRIVTPELLAAEKRRTDAVMRLRDLGWQTVGHPSPPATTEQMEAMIAVLEAPRG